MAVKVELQVTKNYDFLNDCWELYNIFVLRGSTRSSKTFAIVMFLILKALAIPNLTIRCYRHDSTTHEKGAIADMDVILGPGTPELPMMNLKVGKKGHYTKNISSKIYKFRNGSEISFSATNDVLKLHGPGADITWLNEVMEISLEAYRQLAYRTRGKIIMDFNPKFSKHWVFENILSRKTGVCFMHSTYEDNPFLSAEQIYEIESTDPSNPENVKNGTADAYEWAVYGCGECGVIKGAVFEYWDVTDYWPTVEQCDRHGYGLDFGFQVSPTAFVECALHNRVLYLREHMYHRKVLTVKNITKPSLPSIQGKFEEMNIDNMVMICADSANPEAIQALSNFDYNVTPVQKRKGTSDSSLLEGIQIMKRFKILVHEDSPNLQKEMEHYRWREQSYKDAEVQLIAKPIKIDDHLIDAARYWCMMNLTGNMNEFGPVQPHQNYYNVNKENINLARDRHII